MTLHLDYGDLTPLLSLWHFIKHSIDMLLAMALPPPRVVAPPPPSRDMEYDMEYAELRCTRNQVSICPVHGSSSIVMRD
jgi:hypothetical protein